MDMKDGPWHEMMHKRKRLDGNVKTLMMVQGSCVEHREVVTIRSLTTRAGPKNGHVWIIQKGRAVVNGGRSANQFIPPQMIGDDNMVSKATRQPLDNQKPSENTGPFA